MRPYQWQAAADHLHAIPNTEDARYPPLPGSVHEAACGLTLELSTSDFCRGVRRGMCNTCHTRWAEQEIAAAGKPQRSWNRR
jgi:hypothetical protein